MGCPGHGQWYLIHSLGVCCVAGASLTNIFDDSVGASLAVCLVGVHLDCQGLMILSIMDNVYWTLCNFAEAAIVSRQCLSGRPLSVSYKACLSCLVA